VGGDGESWLAPASALLLFVVSALVTGTLVLWQPAKMLVDGKKKEAGAALCTAGSTLLGVLVIVIVIAILRR
jgi:hypothetical protein